MNDIYTAVEESRDIVIDYPTAPRRSEDGSGKQTWRSLSRSRCTTSPSKRRRVIIRCSLSYQSTSTAVQKVENQSHALRQCLVSSASCHPQYRTRRFPRFLLEKDKCLFLIVFSSRPRRSPVFPVCLLQLLAVLAFCLWYAIWSETCPDASVIRALHLSPADIVIRLFLPRFGRERWLTYDTVDPLCAN